MKAKPEITVIMPVYNAGSYVLPAVQSVFAQTISDWELIAVDDASTDGSGEFFLNIDDPRVLVLRNEKNLGVSASINRAIDSARGRLIARMDADDLMFSTRFEKQLYALDANPQVDVLGTGGAVTDKELRPIAVRRPPVTHKEICSIAWAQFPLTFGALMGKTDWWRKWRVDEKIPTAGHEYDLYFRSYRHSTFSNVPDVLYLYRYVGHTRKLSKMSEALYYRAITLCRHGFNRDTWLTALVGLFSLVPRFVAQSLKFAVGSKTALTKKQGVSNISEDDLRLIEAEKTRVFKTGLPLKKSIC